MPGSTRFPGLMAAVGTNQLKSFQFISEEFNKKNASGVKFEIIGIDNKLQPARDVQRTALCHGPGRSLRGAGQQLRPGAGYHRCAGKAQRTQPRQGSAVFLNYAAVDPDLTNSKCSYWHFRLDADTSMKMEALTTYIKDVPEVKKVYLISGTTRTAGC